MYVPKSIVESKRMVQFTPPEGEMLKIKFEELRVRKVALEKWNNRLYLGYGQFANSLKCNLGSNQVLIRIIWFGF